MIQVVITLLLIAGVSAIYKDYLLASAALLLLLVAFLPYKSISITLQKASFPIGIFFLMLFLLFPLIQTKLDMLEIIKNLGTPLGIIAILAGFFISYIGGKGLHILPSQPVILFGVLIGTLVAVLFFRGLPAGLIIAAGIVALSQYFVSP